LTLKAKAKDMTLNDKDLTRKVKDSKTPQGQGPRPTTLFPPDPIDANGEQK